MSNKEQDIESKDISKRNKPKAVKEKAMNLISRMYFEGISPYDMKPKLLVEGISLSVQSIYTYIRKLKTEWREQRVNNLDDIIFEELAKLDNLEQTLWEAWNRSCEQEKKESVSTTRVPITGDDGEKRPQIVEQVIKEDKGLRDGNPKFIELLLNVHEKRMRLVGKDKAVNLFVQNNFQNNNNIVNNTMNNNTYVIEIDERKKED